MSDDLLAQMGAATAFDEIEFGIDFIGAVNGDIDVRMLGEGRQRDAEFDGGRFGGERGGHADDASKLAALERKGDAAGGEDGGAAAAEANGHAGFNEAGGEFACVSLE